MDEFKPEDELKPDTSDRPPVRSRRTSPTVPKLAISRQHMMMGIGILVLLLLVMGIGSALKSPGDSHGQQAAQNGNGGAAKSIDLSGSSPMTGATDAPAQTANAGQQTAPQQLSAPPVSSTPTEAAPLTHPQNQQRVEVTGDLNNALTANPQQMSATDGKVSGSSLPTDPATLAPGGSKAAAVTPHPSTAPRHHAAATEHRQTASKPTVKAQKPAVAASHHPAAQSSVAASHSAPAASGSVPGGHFTLQLSSASRPDTLNAWAKKQNLSGYHVYQTTRNGQPWYVLVSGSYATSGEAKRAVASLPAEVQAKNPWVKPVSQVKKEAGH